MTDHVTAGVEPRFRIRRRWRHLPYDACTNTALNHPSTRGDALVIKGNKLFFPLTTFANVEQKSSLNFFFTF